MEIPIAWWSKNTQEETCILYIASKSAGKAIPAYGEVVSSLRSSPSASISVTDVRLIHPDDPATQDVATIRGNQHADAPTHYFGHRIGDIEIQELYVYAISVTTTAD